MEFFEQASGHWKEQYSPRPMRMEAANPLDNKEWIQLAIHLSDCSICRLFQRQGCWINRMLRMIFHSTHGQESILSERFKQQLQQKIDERLK